MLGESLAKRVAILLGAELREDGQDQGAAAQLHADVLEEMGFGGHTVHHPLYGIHCMAYSIGCQAFFRVFWRAAREWFRLRAKAHGKRSLRGSFGPLSVQAGRVARGRDAKTK